MARRPSPTRHGRNWKRHEPSSHERPARRVPLTPEELDDLANKMQARFQWDARPRFFQLEGVRAQLEGIDAIIQAPTGSGKTAIAAGPYVWPGNDMKTTIMVCPLLALEEEMVETFRDDFGLTAVALNSQTGACKPQVIKDILAGQYRVILISPEMLQSRMFINRVLRNTSFTRRIQSVVVDEAHCVSHWGANFRKKYASLGIIRAFLPRGTPVIAVTATLTARVRRDLHSKLHFPKTGSLFVNIGNDRPNVSLVVRACEHPQNTFADLDFVVPDRLDNPNDLPKTYIYADNIATGTQIVDHLQSLVRQRNPHLADLGLIRPYNATMSQEYRTKAMTAFKANGLGEDETGRPVGQIRILVCTDAAGMGCNVPDIDIVIQWKLPATLSNFVQRAGRAARGRNRTGLAVLLVERTVYSVNLEEHSERPERDSTHQKRRKNAPKTAKKKPPKDYAQKHGVNRGGTAKVDTVPQLPAQPQIDPDAVDEGLTAFVQTTQCRRKVWAEVFDTEPQDATVPCCDICDPSLFDHTRPGAKRVSTKLKMPARGLCDISAWTKLDKWREDVMARDHPTAHFDASTILNDDSLTLLCSIGNVSDSRLRHLLQASWPWWSKYGHELAGLIGALEINYIPVPKTSNKRQAAAAALTADVSTTRPAKCVRPAGLTTQVRQPCGTPGEPSSSIATAPAVDPDTRLPSQSESMVVRHNHSLSLPGIPQVPVAPPWPFVPQSSPMPSQFNPPSMFMTHGSYSPNVAHTGLAPSSSQAVHESISSLQMNTHSNFGPAIQFPDLSDAYMLTPENFMSESRGRARGRARARGGRGRVTRRGSQL